MNKENKIKYDSSVKDLLENIKLDYSKWSTWKKGIKEFNDGIYVKSGIKFDKVIAGSSVWGFIAKVDGTHKGVPMLKGDILKAATWRAPAKHSRGSIFDSEMHKSFSWTGPNYL